MSLGTQNPTLFRTAGHKRAMKLSFKYGERTSQNTVVKGKKVPENKTLTGDRTPDEDEVLIDLDETDKKKIDEYRRFVDKNRALYELLYAQEMFVLTCSHKGGVAGAKKDAEKLFRMHVNIKNPGETRSFEDHFTKMHFLIEKVTDRRKGLNKLSFEYGEYRSQFVLGGDPGDNNHHIVFAGGLPDSLEFIIDVRKTNMDKIEEYRRFVLKSEETFNTYQYTFGMEMSALTRAYAAGDIKSKERARLLFATHSKIIRKNQDFEEAFAGALKVLEKSS